MEQLQNLAAWAANFKLEDAPGNVVEAAKDCVLDTVAGAIGANQDKLCQGVREEYMKSCSAPGYGATVWGSGEEAPVFIAAFLNAMAGHTLEMDDVHTDSKTHIGTVVIPAAWAAAQSACADGRAFLEAVICGYEVTSRIGMGFGVSSHRNRGWHVTGTAGVFGAAAACGKIFRFDEAQMVSALGLAGMQACSTWAFLTGGATDKVEHPARAAAGGIESCMMVRGGMVGTPEILNAEDGGLFPMMSDEFDYDTVDRGLGSRWEILNVDKKPYPCCRSTHGSIDAAIELRNRCRLDPEDIDHIDIGTYLVGYKQCGLSGGSLKPVLPTEAKFSTPYVTAVALLTGKVDLSDFTPDVIADPGRQALLARVHVHPEDQFTSQYPSHWGCRMDICMKDGAVYSATIPDASGSVSQPLTHRQTLQKAYNCCASLPREALQGLFEAIEAVDSLAALPCTKLI